MHSECDIAVKVSEFQMTTKQIQKKIVNVIYFVEMVGLGTSKLKYRCIEANNLLPET